MMSVRTRARQMRQTEIPLEFTFQMSSSQEFVSRGWQELNSSSHHCCLSGSALGTNWSLLGARTKNIMKGFQRGGWHLNSQDNSWLLWCHSLQTVRKPQQSGRVLLTDVSTIRKFKPFLQLKILSGTRTETVIRNTHEDLGWTTKHFFLSLRLRVPKTKSRFFSPEKTCLKHHDIKNHQREESQGENKMQQPLPQPFQSLRSPTLWECSATKALSSPICFLGKPGKKGLCNLLPKHTRKPYQNILNYFPWQNVGLASSTEKDTFNLPAKYKQEKGKVQAAQSRVSGNSWAWTNSFHLRPFRQVDKEEVNLGYLCFFIWDLFIWKAQWERQILHSLGHFPNGYNALSGVKLKPKSRSFFRLPTWVQLPSFVGLPGTSAGNWIKSRAARTQTGTYMWC